jgi:hypothetical protein
MGGLPVRPPTQFAELRPIGIQVGDGVPIAYA